MTYLLDTDTLIDCLVGSNATRDHVLGFIERGDEVAVCAITVTELYSGMNDNRRAQWEPWLRALPYWQISFEVAVQAGVHRKAAAASGRTLSASWHRWSAAALTAYAFLVVGALLEHQASSDDHGELVPLSCPELQHLLATTVLPSPCRDHDRVQRWSLWRRRHQAIARNCHRAWNAYADRVE